MTQMTHNTHNIISTILVKSKICEHFSTHVIKFIKTRPFEWFKLKQKETNIRLASSNVFEKENSMLIWLTQTPISKYHTQ
jgi:hypothetical protein